MNSNKPLLKEILPKLCNELKTLLKKDNQIPLAESVDSLRIFEKCSCGEKSCASFYTVPKPNDGYGKEHETLILNAKYGLLVLDVVNDEIRFIEILDRPKYKTLIDQL